MEALQRKQDVSLMGLFFEWIDKHTQPNNVRFPFEFGNDGVFVCSTGSPRMFNERGQVSKRQIKAVSVFIVGEMQGVRFRKSCHTASMPEGPFDNVWQSNG